MEFNIPQVVSEDDFVKIEETVDDLQWLKERLHRLKHKGPEELLTELHQMLARYPDWLRTLMTLTASFDHRVLVGLQGALFLQDLKQHLEPSYRPI